MYVNLLTALLIMVLIKQDCC